MTCRSRTDLFHRKNPHSSKIVPPARPMSVDRASTRPTKSVVWEYLCQIHCNESNTLLSSRARPMSVQHQSTRSTIEIYRTESFFVQQIVIAATLFLERLTLLPEGNDTLTAVASSKGDPLLSPLTKVTQYQSQHHLNMITTSALQQHSDSPFSMVCSM